MITFIIVALLIFGGLYIAYLLISLLWAILGEMVTGICDIFEI